jgi:hypothetical protein
MVVLSKIQVLWDVTLCHGLVDWYMGSGPFSPIAPRPQRNRLSWEPSRLAKAPDGPQVVSWVEWFLMVQKIMMPSLSRIKWSKVLLALLYLEDGGTAVL